MAPKLNDQDLHQLADALNDARRPRPWPRAMQLPAVLDELRLWLADDRQWHSASAGNWKSMMQELKRVIDAQPDRVLQLAGDPGTLRSEAKRFAAAQADSIHRSEESQRRRIQLWTDTLRERLQSAAAVEAAWDEFLTSPVPRDHARDAAERFLSYARWAGHDSEALRKLIGGDLIGLRLDGSSPTPAERLAATLKRVRRDAACGNVVVWLLLKFARIGDPLSIGVGPNVTLYDADWTLLALREQRDRLPDETATPLGAERIEMLCDAKSRSESDVPDALIRISFDDVIRAEAVNDARLTASTIGAFGALYGNAEPSLWQVDPSYVTFSDGEVGTSYFHASLVGSPTLTESIGARRDCTALALVNDQERFGRHLPVREGPMARAAQVLRWLRDSQTSAPPARLVLCDRAIESVSASAGFGSRKRFVDLYLARSWAWSQVKRAFHDVAAEIILGFDLAHSPAGSEARVAWERLMADEQLGLRRTEHGGFHYLPAEMIRRLDWLTDVLPRDSEAARHLSRVAPHFVSAHATLQWHDALYEQAQNNESRRLRTRNSIMHGGPLSDDTVDIVLPFAEYMASEAVDVAVAAQLEGVGIVDYVIELRTLHDEYRRRLESGTPPDAALFPETE